MHRKINNFKKNKLTLKNPKIEKATKKMTARTTRGSLKIGLLTFEIGSQVHRFKIEGVLPKNNTELA